MEREENKLFERLKRLYRIRLGWELSIEKAPQGATVIVVNRRWDLDPLTSVIARELWNQLEDAGIVSRGVEECEYGCHIWRWVVTDPVGALRMLASFIGVSLSDAKARLLWLGK